MQDLSAEEFSDLTEAIDPDADDEGPDAFSPFFFRLGRYL
jgi:hypothetical protein